MPSHSKTTASPLNPRLPKTGTLITRKQRMKILSLPFLTHTLSSLCLCRRIAEIPQPTPTTHRKTFLSRNSHPMPSSKNTYICGALICPSLLNLNLIPLDPHRECKNTNFSTRYPCVHQIPRAQRRQAPRPSRLIQCVTSLPSPRCTSPNQPPFSQQKHSTNSSTASLKTLPARSRSLMTSTAWSVLSTVDSWLLPSSMMRRVCESKAVSSLLRGCLGRHIRIRRNAMSGVRWRSLVGPSGLSSVPFAGGG
jgi:hypothetical protein